MSTHPTRAPLVTTSAEEAANMMMSEGGPARSPEPAAENVSACCSWASLHATIDRHPLTTLAVAFSVGLLGGICTRLE